jgi:hypothetical protein
VVHDPVDGCRRHLVIAEHRSPPGEPGVRQPHGAQLRARARQGEAAQGPRRASGSRERGMRCEEMLHAPRQGQPSEHGQPGMQPAQEVPEVPQRVQGRRHPGMARPLVGPPQRRRHHGREGGMGAGPRHALPKSAQIQGLLREEDQLAGHAGSTSMQIGLDSPINNNMELEASTASTSVESAARTLPAFQIQSSL